MGVQRVQPWNTPMRAGAAQACTGMDGRDVPAFNSPRAATFETDDMKRLRIAGPGLDGQPGQRRAPSSAVARWAAGQGAARQHRPERAVSPRLAPDCEPGARRARQLWQAAHRPHDDRPHAHFFNLGHGISQFTPPEHVAALVEAVQLLARSASVEPYAAPLMHEWFLPALQPIPPAAGGKVATNP